MYICIYVYIIYIYIAPQSRLLVPIKGSMKHMLVFFSMKHMLNFF